MSQSLKGMLGVFKCSNFYLISYILY